MRSNDQRLVVLFSRVNQQYFQGQLTIRGIFWTKHCMLTYGWPRKALWGQCLLKYHGIRLHESLRDIAPRYVIEYLIFHECLHFQWAIHCPAFNRAERKFKHYKKADQWLARHNYLVVGRPDF